MFIANKNLKPNVKTYFYFVIKKRRDAEKALIFNKLSKNLFT